jgi:hypothetical protein
VGLCSKRTLFFAYSSFTPCRSSRDDIRFQSLSSVSLSSYKLLAGLSGRGLGVAFAAAVMSAGLVCNVIVAYLP